MRSCGRKLTVTYSGNAGNVLRYICKSGVINHNEDKCISFSGAPADEAVVARSCAFSNRSAWMRRFAPSKRMQMPSWRRFGSMKSRSSVHNTRHGVRGGQYDAVDPENRQVAGELERRWNERLIAVQAVTDALERTREANVNVGLSKEDRNACLELGANIEQAWTHEG